MVGTLRGSHGRLTLVVGVAAALTLTACGGSSKPAATPTSTKPTSTVAPTTTTVANPAADKAAAQSLGFVQADLPGGWVGTPHQDGPEDAQVSKKVADCAGASDPSTQTAEVSSPDFDNGNAEVRSDVTLAPTRAAFQQDAAALRRTKYRTCIQTIFETELSADLAKDSPGVKLGPLSVSRFTVPTYGEVTVALRLATTVTGPTGASIHLYIDAIEYGLGRAEVSLTFSNQDAPFDQSLEQSLVAKAAAKLKTSAA